MTNMTNMINLIDKLSTTHTLSYDEMYQLIEHRNEELANYLFEKARQVRILYYGHDVYMRGLIEFTNYCRNDCYYCGIRKSNCNAERYRLTKSKYLNAVTWDMSWVFALRASRGRRRLLYRQNFGGHSKQHQGKISRLCDYSLFGWKKLWKL